MREIKTLKTAVTKADNIGVTILRSLREGNTTFREIHCPNCENTTNVQDQTLSRWSKQGRKFCAICNGANKGIPDNVRISRLNEEMPVLYKNKIKVVEYLGYNPEIRHSFVLVEFTNCKHTKEYNTTTLRNMMKAGKAFKCDTCGNMSASVMEDWCNELFTNLEKQVPYACIGSTKRRWIADYYDENTNTIIEVTTEGQQHQGKYTSNILEKIEWCKLNNINIKVINNLNELDDIVRALEKSKE